MTSPTSSTELSTQSRIATIGKLSYLDFFGLSAPPFRNTTLISSYFTNEALSAARVGIASALERPDGGIMLITGPAGSGKTTLADQIVTQRTETAIVARMNRTLLAAPDFLQLLLLAFQIETPEQADLVRLVDTFDHFLRQQEQADRTVILLIDEAHNLEPEVVELLPRLIAGQTGSWARFFIILVGQDALEQTLNLPANQRFGGLVRYRCRLPTLTRNDTSTYIRHQIETAGHRGANPFTDDAMSRIHQHTSGSMRLINTLCDFILFNAFLGRIHRITPDLVQTTFNTLQWDPVKTAPEDQDSAPDNEGKGLKLILEFDGDTQYPIAKDSVTIGRSLDNDICIRDLRISRYHARLTTNRKGISIEDLNSLNGVYVNSERVKIRLLRDGDLISIDDHRIRFSDAR